MDNIPSHVSGIAWRNGDLTGRELSSKIAKVKKAANNTLPQYNDCFVA